MIKLLTITEHESAAEFKLKQRVFNFLIEKAKRHSLARKRPMALFADDWISLNVMISGLYEKPQLAMLEKLFVTLGINRSEATAIDVGANVGNHSLAFAASFSNVVAFEPNPTTFSLLQFNCSFLSNIQPYNIGIGKEAGNLTLYLDSQQSGKASCVTKQNSGERQLISVSPLDAYLEDFESVKLIKIDVEGMENAVLEGGKKLISRDQPVITFEQHPSDFQNDGRETEAIRTLRELDYKFYWHGEERSSLANFSSKLASLKYALLGRNRVWSLETGTEVPPWFHSMLIAIPADKAQHLQQSE